MGFDFISERQTACTRRFPVFRENVFKVFTCRALEIGKQILYLSSGKVQSNVEFPVPCFGYSPESCCYEKKSN